MSCRICRVFLQSNFTCRVLMIDLLRMNPLNPVRVTCHWCIVMTEGLRDWGTERLTLSTSPSLRNKLSSRCCCRAHGRSHPLVYIGARRGEAYKWLCSSLPLFVLRVHTVTLLKTGNSDNLAKYERGHIANLRLAFNSILFLTQIYTIYIIYTIYWWVQVCVCIVNIPNCLWYSSML